MKQFKLALETVLTLVVFAVIAYGIFATISALSVGIVGVNP